MIRKYYSTEKPLPADIKTVQRIVGARTKEEKNSVTAVLQEFFYLEADGFHNARCDAEIEKYRTGEPEREVKKANEQNRLKQHRDERAKLFKLLTDAGFHAPWNIGINELRELVQRHCNGLETPQGEETATAPATPETETATPPETAPATPATATQTPDTRHHIPIESQLLKPPDKPAKFSAHDFLIESGVSESVATDWLTLRKQKKAPATETAINGIVSEAGKAGITLQTALETCCQRGWQGFKAEWFDGNGGNARASPGSFAQQRDAERKRVGDFLTGRTKNERTNATERDITGEVLRLA